MRLPGYYGTEEAMSFAERPQIEKLIYFGIRRSEGNLPDVELGDTVVYYRRSGDKKLQVEKAGAECLGEVCRRVITGELECFGVGKYAEVRRHATGHIDLMIRSAVPDLDDRIV